MTDDRNAHGELLPDAERITPFGHFLRSTSLDELPCLLNVAKGEMSFVGPRPFMADYLPLYTPEQMRRHAVMPGITGWAQEIGRARVRTPVTNANIVCRLLLEKQKTTKTQTKHI